MPCSRFGAALVSRCIEQSESETAFTFSLLISLLHHVGGLPYCPTLSVLSGSLSPPAKIRVGKDPRPARSGAPSRSQHSLPCFSQSLFYRRRLEGEKMHTPLVLVRLLGFPLSIALLFLLSFPLLSPTREAVCARRGPRYSGGPPSAASAVSAISASKPTPKSSIGCRAVSEATLPAAGDVCHFVASSSMITLMS